jgi:hypothetical protein
LTVHFCGGSLAGVSAISQELVCELQTAKNVPCCSKTVVSKPGCCNDAVVDLSEVDEVSLFNDTDIDKQLLTISPVIASYFLKNRNFKNKLALPNYTFQSNAPPLYKLFGTFIHYA